MLESEARENVSCDFEPFGANIPKNGLSLEKCRINIGEYTAFVGKVEKSQKCRVEKISRGTAGGVFSTKLFKKQGVFSTKLF